MVRSQFPLSVTKSIMTRDGIRIHKKVTFFTHGDAPVGTAVYEIMKGRMLEIPATLEGRYGSRSTLDALFLSVLAKWLNAPLTDEEETNIRGLLSL